MLEKERNETKVPKKMIVKGNERIVERRKTKKE